MRDISPVGGQVAQSSSAACGDDEGGGTSAGGGGGGDKPYIAIVSKGFQHQFWQAVKQGAEEEAAKEGVRITFQGPPTEQDIEQQVTMLAKGLQQNPDAIGFAALDSKATAPLMDHAKAQDIPVVAFDSGFEATSRSPRPRRTTRPPPWRPRAPGPS